MESCEEFYLQKLANEKMFDKKLVNTKSVNDKKMLSAYDQGERIDGCYEKTFPCKDDGCCEKAILKFVGKSYGSAVLPNHGY